jgi:hypothetical protein
MEFEIVSKTDPKAGEVFKSYYNSDEFFRKFVDKYRRVRIAEWGSGGLLYSTPGNVLGLMLSKELDTEGWKISLSWCNKKMGDALCIYRKKENEKLWCIQNEYLEQISELTEKKEITVMYSCHSKYAIIKHNRWIFLIAPTYAFEKDLKWIETIDLKEMGTTIDDLW